MTWFSNSSKVPLLLGSEINIVRPTLRSRTSELDLIPVSFAMLSGIVSLRAPSTLMFWIFKLSSFLVFGRLAGVVVQSS